MRLGERRQSAEEGAEIGSRAAELQEEMGEHAFRFARSDEGGGFKRDARAANKTHRVPTTG